MSLSTHVLDTGRGLPAPGVPVALSRAHGYGWQEIASGHTDDNGRWREPTDDALSAGVTHRIVFDTAAYFDATGQTVFYPEVAVLFRVGDAERHHHVPLLVSQFAYSTYLGS